MEDINDAEYTHTKRVCKDIEIKGLVEYHDLYVLSHTLFLGDVFEICLEIYELDRTHFFSAPKLAWKAALI